VGTEDVLLWAFCVFSAARHASRLRYTLAGPFRFAAFGAPAFSNTRGAPKARKNRSLGCSAAEPQGMVKIIDQALKERQMLRVRPLFARASSLELLQHSTPRHEAQKEGLWIRRLMSPALFL
jgi:hypothetical protein